MLSPYNLAVMAIKKTPHSFLHHMAISVKDGEYMGKENIEFVVDAIAENGKGLLLDVIGSKEQGLKQMLSNASEHSSLIIEYVQRYGSFDGFFYTRKRR